MGELLEILNGINSGEVQVVKKKNNYIGCDQAESLACEHLITDNGQCNWENIGILRDGGFNVFPGEKDSFGWLIGCIRTNKGIICYG